MTKSREVILRLTVHHDNPMALRLFGMEVAPVSAKHPFSSRHFPGSSPLIDVTCHHFSLLPVWPQVLPAQELDALHL
jgi:hypothetical protein